MQIVPSAVNPSSHVQSCELLASLHTALVSRAGGSFYKLGGGRGTIS